MIDVLISGRLRGAPAVRTSARGSTYATFRIGAADKTGESLLCSCVTFSASAIQQVERLADGDSVAVSGEAAVSTWDGKDGTPRRGLDVTVHGVLTPYHAGRKRTSADSTDQESTGGR